MFALRSRRLRRRLSPITSGSARRRARERQRALQTRAEGERLARERRQQRLIEKMEQQRLAREQLASYEPWGKAGGGAPNLRGVRYTNLRATGIYPEDELKGLTLYESCHRWPSPGRRRRTPLRLREDPQICYSDNLRKTVDNDIRYRATPHQQMKYKQTLDDMVTKRKKALKEEMKRDLEYERKMQTIDGPWGKPGPGGTTWRNPRNVGLNFSNSMGWTDNRIFDKIKGDHKMTKNSIALPQVQSRYEINKEANKKEVVNNKENIKPSNEKLPDIKQTNSREGSTKNSGEKKQDDNKKTNAINNEKTKRIQENKFVKRLPNGERLKKIIPDELQIISKKDNEVEKNAMQNSNDKKLTPEDTILRLTGGIELVPLLARKRRIGARTLPSSDVTRPPEQPCQWREVLHADYLRELKRQMQMKYERQQRNRQDSAESVRKHHDTWSSLWGRPGHGAPQQRGRYARSNLAQLLYLAPLTMNAQ